MKIKQHSGINTHLGSKCSQTAFAAAKKTFHHRAGKAAQLIPTVDGSYSSLLSIGKERIGISSDGIGTKVEIAERMNTYNTLGFDLIAMTIDDLVCSGFEPVFISNILDVDSLDERIVAELMQGLYNAASVADIIITGGEIAELGSRIRGYGRRMHFNWCATGIGVLHQSLAVSITGKDISVGDAILAFYNPGFRSNGYSLLRHILKEKFGEKWHLKKSKMLTNTWGEIALTPCQIYSPALMTVMDNAITIKGAAHITGGGIVDNLGRLLKHNNLGAQLTNLFPPENYYHEVMHLGRITAQKAYNYWNMNNGILIVVAPEAVEKTLRLISTLPNYQVREAGVVQGSVPKKGAVLEIGYGNEKLLYTDFYKK